MIHDDSGEATVISQLMIIGITAGIVFVAATYAYFAVDTAINEADHAGAQLALRAEMNRLEGIAQQGIGASTILAVPSQGEVSFSGFSPLGASQDRIIITVDGDATIDVEPDGSRYSSSATACHHVEVQWYWGVGAPAFASSLDCGDEDLGQWLGGIATVRVIDGDGLVTAAAIVADQHLFTVKTSGGESDNVASMVGNLILNRPDNVVSDAHVQSGDALSLRLWALNGPSFASSNPNDRMHVRVTDQSWLVSDLDGDVTISVHGDHGDGILSLYERHGGIRDADSVTFSATTLFVHATAFEGGPMV